MSDPGRPRGGMTYADYAALPDDGKRYQLVEGELIEMPSQTTWHQLVLGEIYVVLRKHVDPRKLGRVMLAPLDVVLSDRNVFQPDVLFISNERAAIFRDANIGGAPNLCIEILSPSSAQLDRVRKRDLYARYGVTHYWIFDLEARTIEELALEGGAYRQRGITAEADVFRPALFPGFEFRLADVELPRS